MKTYKELLNEIEPSLVALVAGAAAAGGVIKGNQSYVKKMTKKNQKDFPEGTQVYSKEYGHGTINRHSVHANKSDIDGEYIHVKDGSGSHTNVDWDNWRDTNIQTSELHKEVKRV